MQLRLSTRIVDGIAVLDCAGRIVFGDESSLLRDVAKKLINENKRKYVHYMIEEIPEKYARLIMPDDFYLPRLRYVDPAPYTQDEFERAYNWMVTWDLVGADAKYERIVCNRIQ